MHYEFHKESYKLVFDFSLYRNSIKANAEGTSTVQRFSGVYISALCLSNALFNLQIRH
jgi:hypothetical protein